MNNTTVRLSKLMSEKGLCSRREADRYIEKGLVLVNGEVIDTLGTKVNPNADIELKHIAQKEQSHKLTILLNKPLGIVSCLPEKGYQAAVELLKEKNRDKAYKTKLKLPSYLPKIAVAGRLDINSKGLLVLTQDGRVAKKLIQDKGLTEKEYLVRVSESVTETQLKLLRHGLSLDEKALLPAVVEQIDTHFLRFVLTEGKKRQIRRMCELVRLKVNSIKRVRIGKITLGKLKEGQWRFLESSECF
ncbi:MAG: Dual-specificity RNA pseudouridine synthase RluF [Chlamydiae bacterium]|nr:Dual-specificity RNA pseudouridine synthase RluF [Chlamydiota bacterium]